jgi:hypothetical protein
VSMIVSGAAVVTSVTHSFAVPAAFFSLTRRVDPFLGALVDVEVRLNSSSVAASEDPLLPPAGSSSEWSLGIEAHTKLGATNSSFVSFVVAGKPLDQPVQTCQHSVASN